MFDFFNVNYNLKKTTSVMEFQGIWFPAKGLIRIYLHTRLSPTINVNKTEMWDLQTDFARIREIKERKSSKKNALSTWPFIYKYPQMQTPLVMRKICAEDDAGSKVHRSDWYLVGIQRVPTCSPIYNVLTSFKKWGTYEVKSTVMCQSY